MPVLVTGAARKAPPCAIIFDFDGVIVDSAQIKLDAYVTIYADEDPRKVEELVRHAELHGGTTRRVKFAQYERELFGRSGDPESVERLSGRYSQLVFDAVMKCPFIDGAQALLATAANKTDMHVVSGTPQDELRRTVVARGLAPFFKTVRGAPATKPEAFAEILRSGGHAAASVVAIGDAMTEFWAAEALGIPFLGIVPKHGSSHFPAGVPTLPSLKDAAALLGLA